MNTHSSTYGFQWKRPVYSIRLRGIPYARYAGQCQFVGADHGELCWSILHKQSLTHDFQPRVDILSTRWLPYCMHINDSNITCWVYHIQLDSLDNVSWRSGVLCWLFRSVRVILVSRDQTISVAITRTIRSQSEKLRKFLSHKSCPLST